MTVLWVVLYVTEENQCGYFMALFHFLTQKLIFDYHSPDY